MEMKQLVDALDVDYAYGFARRMEKYRSNPVLGYRPGGSQAEYQTGEMIAEEMRNLGLTVSKEPFSLDGWEFRRARMTFLDGEGQPYLAELGGYQTDLDTCGPKEMVIINAGRGTARELDKLDVAGKLCLIHINQREDWWINYPAYQAHLRGCAAVVAVQQMGYGEVNAGALNAQDICGPSHAPAMSMSKGDMRKLNLAFGEEKQVTLDACSQVMKGTTSYNILGVREGRRPDRYILISAHYDSYFSGFQDDNTAVALMLGMARAVKMSSWQSNKTILFCAMGAEEWGVSDSKYDWSRGAFCQITNNKPEWRGRCMLNINLELPAHAHGKKHFIRSVYEYRDFLKGQLQLLPKEVKEVYEKGSGVLCPTQTWSDDFSLAIHGVPALVNEFGSGKFMQTHYHSQFDTDAAYNEKVYWYHHVLYTRLLYSVDQMGLPPISFAPRLRALNDSLTCQHLSPKCEGAFRMAVDKAIRKAEKLAKQVKTINLEQTTPGEGLWECLMDIFQQLEDHLTRLSWDDETMFPHGCIQHNWEAIHQALWQLSEKNGKAALKSLCLVDNNRYAAAFDREVYDYFTKGVLNQPNHRLQWGAGRVMGHVDLYDIIKELKVSIKAKKPYDPLALEELKAQEKAALERLHEAVKDETRFIKKLCKQLDQAILSAEQSLK